MERNQQKPFTKITGVLIEIFCRIWVWWALVLFAATLIVAFIFYVPCFFLEDPKKAIWHRHVSRIWMFIYLPLIGCPLRVKGKGNFVYGTNYIVVCNHNSLMDVPVSTPFMPRPNKTIGKKSFTKTPIFGWIYAFGSVLVDRNSDASRKKSYDDMKKILKSGLDMVIYPEGTRNRTNHPLKKFHGGAFRLAVSTGKPIIPAILFHTKKALPADKYFYLRPHILEMHFLPAVESTNLSASELEEIIFKQMWDYFLANDH